MKNNRIIAVFALTLSISFILLVFFSFLFSSFGFLDSVIHRPFKTGVKVSVNVDGFERGVFDDPIYLGPLEPFSHVTYTFTIPEDLPDGDSLSFRKGFSKFDVYIDDELVYQYYENGRESGRPDYGYGTYFFIPLEEGMDGKSVRIEAIEQAAVEGVNLSNITFGDSATLRLKYLWTEIDPILIAAFLIFMSLITLIVSFFTSDKETKKSLLSTSILVLILSLWLFSQSRSRQFFLTNTVLPSSLSAFSMYFLPRAIYNYFISNFPLSGDKKATFFNYSSLLLIALYFLIGLLSIIGIYSYAEALRVATTYIIVYFVSLATYVFFEFFIKKEKVGLFLLIISFIVLSALAEWGLLMAGTNIRGSILLEVLAISMVLVLFKSLYLYVLETQEMKIKEELSDLAYKDGLTGLNNRQSYEKIINSTWRGGRFVDVYMIDVNKLKEINDHDGHMEGNRVLMCVANAISTTFPYFKQKRFRTGGDEFVVMSPSRIGLYHDEAIRNIRYELEKEGLFDIVSIGYYKADTRFIKLKDAVALADRMMYEDKKK